MGCSTTQKVTDTWGSGGEGYSRVSGHFSGESDKGMLNQLNQLWFKVFSFLNFLLYNIKLLPSVALGSMLAVGRMVCRMATALRCTTTGTNTLEDSSREHLSLHFVKPRFPQGGVQEWVWCF